MLHRGIEFIYPVPGPASPFICWWLHVAAGTTQEERRNRLECCPDDLQGQVRDRVVKFFEELKKTGRGK